MSSNLYLVRHGETLWSKSGQQTGRTDLPLTAVGREQARKIASRIAELNVAPNSIYVSPLLRAQQTAKMAGLTKFETSYALAEWSYGAVEGHTNPEISKVIEHNWDIFVDGIDINTASLPTVETPVDEQGNFIPISTLPGESIETVSARAQTFIDHIKLDLLSGKDVLCIAHAHLLRILACDFIGLAPRYANRFRLANCSISTLTYANGTPTILKWNETPWQ